MKKTRIKAKDVARWLEGYPIEINKKDSCELCEDEFTVLAINQLPAFFKKENQWIPTLHYLQKALILPTVTVDMGAIKFVVNGADIMRPGITAVSLFPQDAFVAIIDETHGKAIAVGQALVTSDVMEKQTSGKVVANIHYVGDNLWNWGK